MSLVRIYTLVHDYQTLTREIATPTMTTFFNACLQLIKPPATGQRQRTPSTLVETILDAFSSLLPLYPTTCRPFNGQIRAAIRHFLAPTCSDDTLVPLSLQRASRRLAISLHFTMAGKTGPSDEWAKLMTNAIQDFNLTASQVFRAVKDGGDSFAPASQSPIDFNGPPQGTTSPLELPEWKGVRAGSQRLIGLLRFMADMLRYPTKTAVSLPVGTLVDIINQLCLISRSGKSQSWEQALETHPAVGREEKEELWSVVPTIHIAALDLLCVLVARLQYNALPFALEALDSAVLALKSGIDNPDVRLATYRLFSVLLPICGAGISKPTVDTISIAILACCRDLQQHAGHLDDAKPVPAKKGAETKKNGVAANADLFLPQQQQSDKSSTSARLSREHRAAAESLLADLLTHLPQRHLKPGVRGLLDQTAILAQCKDAMLASALNPYISDTGKSHPSILPHLSRQFPRDQGVETLRSNIRTSAVQATGDGIRLVAGFEELDEQEDGADERAASEIEVAGGASTDGDKVMADVGAANGKSQGTAAAAAADTIVVAGSEDVTRGSETGESPFLPRESSSIEVAGDASTAQKRKFQDADADPPQKRQDVDKKRAAVPVIPDHSAKEGQDGAADDESDDESVHLNMELDDLEDNEDEEDE